MQITIDTNNLTELDRAMLGYLAGVGEDEPEDEVEPEPEPAKPAKKAAAAKKAAPAKEPEPEPEDDEDLVGGPTLSDAIAAATQLVSNGEAAKVKAALADVGAKRVSDLSPEDVPAFLTALEA